MAAGDIRTRRGLGALKKFGGSGAPGKGGLGGQDQVQTGHKQRVRLGGPGTHQRGEPEQGGPRSRRVQGGGSQARSAAQHGGGCGSWFCQAGDAAGGHGHLSLGLAPPAGDTLLGGTPQLGWALPWADTESWSRRVSRAGRDPSGPRSSTPCSSQICLKLNNKA